MRKLTFDSACPVVSSRRAYDSAVVVAWCIVAGVALLVVAAFQ